MAKVNLEQKNCDKNIRELLPIVGILWKIKTGRENEQFEGGVDLRLEMKIYKST